MHNAINYHKFALTTIVDMQIYKRLVKKSMKCKVDIKIVHC